MTAPTLYFSDSIAPLYFSAAVGSRVDRENGIIDGVSVVTSGLEAEGHGIFIDETTLAQVKAAATQFSDGVRVKINHGSGFSDIVGVLRNFRVQGDKLLADLHLLKNHDMRERIMEMAETIPGSVGLSISFSGENEELDGKKCARCSELYSVDFVDRPAANPSGLFSRVDSSPKIMDTKSLLTKFKEFLTGVENELAPVDFEAKSIELKTELTAVNAKVAELAAVKAAFTNMEAAKIKAETELAAANTKLSTFDAEVEKAASAKALQITAGQGQPPLAQTPSETPSSAPKTELTGLARVEAAFKAQTAAKANLQAK